MDENTRSLSVEEMAKCRLQQAHYRFVRCVSCKYREGCLELLGNVPTYYLKQVAQIAVAGIPDVERIENSLQVFVDSRT